MTRLDYPIRDLRPEDGDLIEQALALYQSAFPVEEQDPVEGVRRSIQRNAARKEGQNFHHFQVMLDGETVLGLAIFGFYRATGMGFIAYLAVVEEMRGLGMGGYLYRKIGEQVQADSLALGVPALGVTHEVERPEAASAPEEVELRRRRIGFYQRHGALVVPGIDFIAPPLAENLPEVPYHIMFLPLKDARLPLDRRDTQAVIHTVLGCAYGLQEEDPYYRRCMDSIQIN